MNPKQIINPIKIIHTSDLHLGSDGFKSSVEGKFIPIKQVVDTTLNEKADVLVIAGDLVDHNRVHSDVLAELQNQLNRLSIPIILLPGNHDSLDEDSIYNRAHLVDNCSSLRMFSDPSGEIIHLKNLQLSFWGKPTIHHSPLFLPLGNAPKRNQEKWFVGVAHGLITEESDQHQYRFQDIIDPDNGKQLFEIEHEVRSLFHPMFERHLINRNASQSFFNYQKDRDMFVPVEATS